MPRLPLAALLLTACGGTVVVDADPGPTGATSTGGGEECGYLDSIRDPADTCCTSGHDACAAYYIQLGAHLCGSECVILDGDWTGVGDCRTEQVPDHLSKTGFFPVTVCEL